MKLITKEIEHQFKKQGATGEMDTKDIKIIVKLFNPVGPQKWFLYEHEEGDIYWCFATLGDPQFAECGTVSLNEIKSINLPMGLKIERDLHFGYEHTLEEVITKIKANEYI